MPACSNGATECVVRPSRMSSDIARTDVNQEIAMLERTQEALLHRSRLRARYDNFIGGRWEPPVKGRYFVDASPIDGAKLCEMARSDADDVERALDAAHAARDAWGRTAPAERARMLNQIADRIEDNLELLAY